MCACERFKKQKNKQRFKNDGKDELLYYMLGQVNQERDWDLPQALCATDHCHWQREREPSKNTTLLVQSENRMLYYNKYKQRERKSHGVQCVTGRARPACQ